MKDRLASTPELAVHPAKWMESGSGHIRILIAEIGKLWKVLKQYFHLDQTQMIFGETVQQHYNTHLKQTFAAVPLADEGAVERLVNDIKNYKVNIERFGITVLPADDPEANTEENILKYFLPELNATP